MPKFVLPNAEPGSVVINDRYHFVDGEMPVSKNDAPLIARILCEYHGCTLVEDEVVTEESKPADTGSLAADVTKTDAPVVEAKAKK